MVFVNIRLEWIVGGHKGIRLLLIGVRRADNLAATHLMPPLSLITVHLSISKSPPP